MSPVPCLSTAASPRSRGARLNARGVAPSRHLLAPRALVPLFATAILVAGMPPAPGIAQQPSEPTAGKRQPPEEELPAPEGEDDSADLEDPAEEMSEEIVVWGDRLEESLPLELEQYGARVEVVESERIRDGGYLDVGQILESAVPGLFAASKNGPFDYVDVSLQGSRSKEVLWLVDGVRISNRLYDTTPPIDTLPAHLVERIEVLKGGQSLFYGTQAVGGVINIVTRRPTAEWQGSVSLGADTNDGVHLDGTYGGGRGDHRFVVYGSSADADGYRPFRDRDYQPSATDRERGYDVGSLGGRYRVAIGSAMLLSAHLQHTDAQLDFAAAEDRAVSFNERDELISSLKLDWTPVSRFDLYLKAYWHDWDSTFTHFDNDLDRPGDLIVVDDHAVWEFEDRGLNLLGEIDVRDGLIWAVGYDYQRYDGRDDVFLIGQQTEEVHAVFTQARFSFDLLDGANLAIGARHNEPSDGGSKTVWNLAGELSINESARARHYARALIGTSFRLPSAYELYVIDPCCERGNPDLVGEESFNVEGGFGAQRERLDWEVTLFHRTVDDLIAIDFDRPQFPDGLIVNTDEQVEVMGWEAVLGFRFTDSVSATLSHLHNQAEEEGSSEQIPDVPADLSKLSVTWRPGSLPLALIGGAQHVGELFDTVGGGIGRVEHGDYTLFDLAASYTFAERHRIRLRLDNLFGEEYDTRVLRVRRDVDGSSYAAGTLGLPRTLTASYTLLF